MIESQGKPLVTNSEDREQLDAATDKLQSLEENRSNDLRHVMASPQGRRALWRVLTECQVFGSIMETNARIYYNSGKQDVGHWLLAEMNMASEDLFFEMQKENFLKNKKDKTKGK